MASAAMLLLLVVVAFTACLVTLAIYRLIPHPLAAVPGPKIAALTAWYEFYWDCPRKGQYAFRIQEMHRHYGP